MKDKLKFQILEFLPQKSMIFWDFVSPESRLTGRGGRYGKNKDKEIEIETVLGRIN